MKPSQLLTVLFTTAFAFFDAEEIREDLDDLIDKFENKAEAKRAAKEAAGDSTVKEDIFLASIAWGRKLTGIPDDIAGDTD